MKAGLEPTRVSDSGVVEVRFTYGDADLAEDTVETAAREALVLLLRSRLQPFEAQLAFARDRAESAQQDLLAFQEETGYLEPELVFQREASRMEDLRDRIGVARAEGDDERAEELQARLDEKAAKLIPERAEYETIATAQRRAQEALTTAEIAYDGAASALSSVEDDLSPEGSVISSTAAARVSRTQTFIRMLVPTVVFATILAIVFVVLLELIPGRPASSWARLRRRLPVEDRSSVSRLQAMAARRHGEEAPVDPGPDLSVGPDGDGAMTPGPDPVVAAEAVGAETATGAATDPRSDRPSSGGRGEERADPR